MSFKISVEDAPDEPTQTTISEGLTRFNEAHVGPFPSAPIWVIARDADGAVVGGLQGFVSWTWFYVSMLWVDEPVRGAGLGSSLLREAERKAAEQGCVNALLYTLSFQAPEFYKRHGYVQFGDLEAFPGEHHQLWMRKSLPRA